LDDDEEEDEDDDDEVVEVVAMDKSVWNSALATGSKMSLCPHAQQHVKTHALRASRKYTNGDANSVRTQNHIIYLTHTQRKRKRTAWKRRCIHLWVSSLHKHTHTVSAQVEHT
jgi:hypothetical protein